MHELKAAAARIASVERRVAALGARCDAQVAALEARFAALPAAARFAPFDAAPANGAVADGEPSATAVAASRRPRPLRLDTAAAGVAGPAGAASALPRPSAALALGAAVDGALRQLSATAARTAARRPPPQLPAGPQPARPLEQPRASAADAAQKALQATGATKPKPQRLPLPPRPADAAPPVQHALRALARESRAAVQLPGAAVQHVAAPLASPAGVKPAPSRDGALPAADLIVRQLKALAPSATPQRRVAPALAKAGGAAAQAASTPLAAAAPRAVSRLLAPAPAADAPTRQGAQPPEASEALDGDNPLAELNRQLIDQAWLRGVDLR